MLHTLLCLGLTFPIGFITGWASAETATGRVAARRRFDREQRRHEATRARQRAAAAKRTERDQ